MVRKLLLSLFILLTFCVNEALATHDMIVIKRHSSSMGWNPGFATDTHLKALWRFEPGALTTDSKGTNTLTNDGVDEEVVDYKEGSGCGKWEYTNTDFQYITDAGWIGPWKSTDEVKSGSVCAWVNVESVHAGEDLVIFNKSVYSSKLSVLFYIAEDLTASMALGFDGGTDSENHSHETTLDVATWYYITWSYDNSDKSYAIRIRDTSGNVVGTDFTGTATLDANKLSVGTARIDIGQYYPEGAGWNFFDGPLDEMAVFDDIITADETTAISKGVY